MKISWITNPKLMVISVATLESYNAIFRDFFLKFSAKVMNKFEESESEPDIFFCLF